LCVNRNNLQTLSTKTNRRRFNDDVFTNTLWKKHIQSYQKLTSVLKT